jgi:protein AaeX
VFISPALICLAAALLISLISRRLLDKTGINRFVWNRALFDLSLLIAIAALLILSLRFGEA